MANSDCFSHQLSAFLQRFAEVGNRLFDALLKRDFGFPAEGFLGESDVGTALFRVIRGKREMGDLGLSSHLLEHEFCQLEHGELTRVAKVHRTDNLLLLHEAHESLDEIVDIAEGAGLGTLTVNREILTLQGLNDEVGDDASIVWKHARTVGIENTDDTDIDAVFAMIVKEERLGRTLPLIIAGAQSNGIHVPPIGFGLRVNIGITINLRGGGLEDACLDPLGKAKAVDGTDHGGLHRLDGIILVVGWRSRAGKVIDTIDLKLEWVDDVVANEFEAGIPQEVLDIGLATGEEIIKANDFMPLLDEAVAKVGAKESSSAGDKDTHGENVTRS